MFFLFQRLLLLTFVFLLKECDAQDRQLHYRAPTSLNWKNLDGIEGFNGSLHLTDGSSIHRKTKPFCVGFSKDACASLRDQISLTFYGVGYTPSRPNSQLEDFQAQPRDVIFYLAKRFQFKHYLEIGCKDDETFGPMSQLFEYSAGVDPASGGTHRMTSDSFFQQNKQTFDLIFIDGLHTGEQVYLDVLNALEVLEEGGIIVLHDLNPNREIYQLKQPAHAFWNGDCWRAAVALRMRDDLDMVVVDVDQGVGVIRRYPNSNKLPSVWAKRLKSAGGLNEDGTCTSMEFINEISYKEFDEHRETFSKLVTLHEFREWLQEPSRTVELKF